MKTKKLDTRAESYKQILNQLSLRQYDVTLALQALSRATCFQIANYLELPVHSVSGRVTELKKKGVVLDTGRRVINPASGEKVAVYRLV